MLFRRIGIVILVFACATGCLSAPQDERAFSHDWADKVQREKTFEARKERMRNKGGSLVGTDEEGNPKLNLGKDKGLGADVDLQGGKPAGEVKYEIKW